MLLKSEKQAIMKEYARFERRHRLSGGTGSCIDLQNQPADGALQGAQARLPLSAWSDEDGWSS